MSKYSETAFIRGKAEEQKRILEIINELQKRKLMLNTEYNMLGYLKEKIKEDGK